LYGLINIHLPKYLFMKRLQSFAILGAYLLFIFSAFNCSKDDGGSTTITPPVLSTTTVSSITTTTAISGGTVSSNGGGTITAKGICWSTAHNPTIADSKTIESTSANIFISSITSLSANTTYFVRAYATNSAGTGYGVEQTFTTLSVGSASIPTLTTTAISSITSAGASSGGAISLDGGAAVTARGVCWSTSANPTIADAKTTNGTGTGAFVSSITGLAANTTYHVRAYATNSVGTAYGNDVSFTTSAASSLVNISIVSTSSGFSPSTKSVSLGTVVKWTNNDAVTHTVTSDDGVTFNSGNISPGASFSYTTSSTGTFGYHCNIHSSMSGTLTVTP
jgi:plastocyanin